MTSAGTNTTEEKEDKVFGVRIEEGHEQVFVFAPEWEQKS